MPTSAASPTPAPAPKGLGGTVTTYVHDAETGVEHTVSSVHVNGWLLLAAIVAANLVGVFFHF